MDYFIDYQLMPKGHARPQDDGAVVDIKTSDAGFAALPNVGDFVAIQNSPEHGGASFHGRVRSRLFRYFDGKHCYINIIVEETDDDWGALEKS